MKLPLSLTAFGLPQSPPSPHGLIAVRREVATIQARQDKDPTYQHPVVLPEGAAPARLGAGNQAK